MKKLTFVRYGGLSSVNHKKFYKLDTAHSPPLKRGIYVFHPKFIERFLVAWKLIDDEGKRKKGVKRREFKYSGKIWTHLYYIHPEIIYYRENKGWYETDTSCVDKILSIYMKTENKEMNNDTNIKPKDVYLRNGWKWCCKDFLEFFIEKV